MGAKKECHGGTSDEAGGGRFKQFRKGMSPKLGAFAALEGMVAWAMEMDTEERGFWRGQS